MNGLKNDWMHMLETIRVHNSHCNVLAELNRMKHQPGLKSSTEFWKLREFSSTDFDAYAGVECEVPYICDVAIDGYEGQMVVEPDYVGIYVMSEGITERQITFERDFGKNSSDSFSLSLEIGMKFANWLIDEVSGEWGLDDLVDIAGMVKH